MIEDVTMMQPRVWVVIPVYNNGATVREIGLGCLRELPDVVVVDDGSTDADVAALFTGSGVTVLRHETNQGKGRAILTGLRYAGERGADFMITVDADGQHHPADIRKFLPVLAAHPAAIVIGARDMEVPNVPGSSRFGMKFSDFWVRLETGLSVRDTQSGFRAYPVKYLLQLECVSNNYDFEIEMLVRAAWAGLEVKSVDIGVTYPEKGKRISHFRPFMDNLRLSYRHMLLVMRRLVPWPYTKLVKGEPDEMRLFLRHPAKFLRQMLSEHALPAELGMSAGVGVFLATLPLLAMHTVVILYVTTRFRLNRVMAVAIQNLCMPPVVPFLCMELGYFMRHGKWLTEMTRETWVTQAPQRLWEWLLGSLVVGPVLGVIIGLLVYGIAAWLGRKKGVRIPPSPGSYGATSQESEVRGKP